MDLQGALIVGGVTVVVCAVLILVSLFGSSGTSYEEAMAEQKRATNELLALTGNNKQVVKKSKKAGKKAKEKKHKETAPGSERESDAPADSAPEEETPAPATAAAVAAAPQRAHVEFGESTVVDVSLDKPVKPQAEKKEEVIEKKESKSSKSGKGKHGKQASAPAPAPSPPEPVVEELVLVKERHNSGDSAKEQRRTKRNDKKQSVDETGDKISKDEPATVPLNQVSQPTDLTTDKILKQVQAPSTSTPAKKKNKKAEQNVAALVGSDVGGVNVAELVRLVSEASLSRTEIQILTDALLNKQHGPLPQHSEWTEGPNDPVQKLKKQLAEKEKALADEQEASQAMHAKLKELRASLNVERSRANAATRASEEAASNSKVEIHTLQARMQRLLDDNHALTQDKHLLQSKLQSEGEAQAQRVQLEMHIQRISESETALMSQLQALQVEVGARVVEVGQARCDAAQARDATHQVQLHAADLAQQLQESNRICGELEAARASSAHAEASALAELRSANERVAELQSEVQRLSRANHASMHAERSLEEADRQNRQLSNEIKSLHEQLAAKEEQIKMEHTNHQQNGIPHQEETQKQKTEVSRLEVALEELRGELAAAQAASADEQRQLNSLHAQIQQYRDKNNEAVVKALEQQYRETAEILRAACPEVAPSGSADKQWLATFAEQLSTVLRAAGTAQSHEAVDNEDATELRGQNAHLQELVDKYKRIIQDTEGVLSELQHNVTAEEQRWARLLRDKQSELDRLQQTTITQMQSKIDSLQRELEHARAPRSLADVERGLEETNRLLTINDKHPIESLNGPTQVGLEEK